MTDYPRILGLDWGTKRIGVALSDPFLLTASALPFIVNNDQALSHIQTLIIQKDVKTIVLGNPLKLSGAESQKSHEVREFQAQLKTITDCEIILWDERFSSVSAEKHLIAMDMRRNKRKTEIDSLAATFTLQSYLDFLSSHIMSLH